jgi:cell division protein FtsB
MALETTAKLAVNILISTAAVTALWQLLPYQWLQQQKLRQIDAEVSQIEAHVNRLRSDFSRYFDPQQAKNIMQEQSQRVDPTQRQIIWLQQHNKIRQNPTP